jgi:predicted acyl esterase
MELKPCVKSETVTYTVYPEHIKEFLAERYDARDLIVEYVFERFECSPTYVLDHMIRLMLGLSIDAKVCINANTGGNRNECWCVDVTTYTREDDE